MHPDRRAHIRRISKLVSALCLAYVVVAAATAALTFWLAGPALDGLSLRLGEIGRLGAEVGAPFAPRRVAGFALLSVPVLVQLWGVWQLKRLFDAFRRGEYFSPRAIGHMRGFGLATAAAVPLAILAAMGLPFVLGLEGFDGWRDAPLTLSSAHAVRFTLGLVFVAIAHVLAEGRRLEEENAQFV